jgi:hypothetical protein
MMMRILMCMCLSAGTGATHTPTTPDLRTAAVVHALEKRERQVEKETRLTDEEQLVNDMKSILVCSAY